MEDPEDGPIKFINPSASSSAEDTEMIGLGAEVSANSENIDPNVQAEKKSASLSRPLSSASNLTSKETAKSGTYCLAISYSKLLLFSYNTSNCLNNIN